MNVLLFPVVSMDNTVNEVSQVLHEFEEAVEKFDGNNTVKDLQVSPLPIASKAPNDILKIIQDVIVNLNLSKDDQEPNLAILPALNNIEKLCITSHSIIQYILCLDTVHSDYIFKWMYNETNAWLSDLFRFKKYDAIIDDNVPESISIVFRVIISQKYPSYSDEGYHSFRKEPVIYVDDDSSMIIANYICRNCSLPLCCVRKIVLHDSSQDVSILLQNIFEDDVNAGKIPIMAIVDAETKLTPHRTIVNYFQKFCAQNKIWLHVNGSLLAALPILQNTNDDIDSNFIADSFTVRLGQWLNIPALPTATLCRRLESDKHWNTFVPSRHVNANSLPIWTILQCLGSDDVKSRFMQKFDSCRKLYFKLQTYDCLKLLSQPPGDEDDNISVSDLMTRNKPDDMLEHLITSVTFKFVPENKDMWSSNYCDKLNSWLNQVLSRELPEIRTNIIYLENQRLALQFCPFESSSTPDDSTWIKFYFCLEQQLDILKSTVAQKAVLYNLLSESSNLKIVELQDWAGLGGVCYIPQGWDQIITDQAKNELNRLNIQIVNQLRNTDTAFSAGDGDDGLVCIRFGMVGSDSNVADLMSLVETIGKQEEESWNFIDTMAEVVKKGIETAMVDLQKENEDKIWQEGILRHVPVFGSLVNWWSPIPKDSDIVKGRSFDLNAGVISSTENIYRYHVQNPVLPTPSNDDDQSDEEDKIPVSLTNGTKSDRPNDNPDNSNTSPSHSD